MYLQCVSNGDTPVLLKTIETIFVVETNQNDSF